MTYDQFEDLLATLTEKYISRDCSLEPIDIAYEDENFAAALSKALRIEGYNIPKPENSND